MLKLRTKIEAISLVSLLIILSFSSAWAVTRNIQSNKETISGGTYYFKGNYQINDSLNLSSRTTFTNTVNLYNGSQIDRLDFNASDIIRNNLNWRKWSDFETKEFVQDGGAGLVSYNASDILNPLFSGKEVLRIHAHSDITAASNTTLSKYLHDITKNRVRIMVYGINMQFTDVFSLDFYIGGSATDYYEFNGTVALRSVPQSTWTQFVFPEVKKVGNPANTWDVTKISFRLSFSAGHEGAVKIDDMEILYPIFPQGAVTFCFDDGYQSVYTSAFSMMEKYGFKGVAGIVHKNIEYGHTGGPYAYFNNSEAKVLQSFGWDIVNHGYNHVNPTNHTYAEVLADIENNMFYMKNNSFLGYHFYFTPYGGYTLANVPIFQKLCYFIRPVGTSTDNNSFPPVDELSYRGIYNFVYVDDANPTFTNLRPRINDSITYGKWLIILYHGVGSGYGAVTNFTFNMTCNYLYNRSVPVITFSEAWARLNGEIQNQLSILESLPMYNTTHIPYIENNMMVNWYNMTNNRFYTISKFNNTLFCNPWSISENHGNVSVANNGTINPGFLSTPTWADVKSQMMNITASCIIVGGVIKVRLVDIHTGSPPGGSWPVYWEAKV